MFKFRRLHDHLILLLISACSLLFASEPASSQMSSVERHGIATGLTAEINRAIATHRSEGIVLREKVAGRLAQCAVFFSLMSKGASDPETSKHFGDITAISTALATLVSEGIALDRFKEIVGEAQKITMEKFSVRHTQEGERETSFAFKNCRLFHSLAEIPDAVAELHTASERRDEMSIQFAKELQECSLYYLLLAGDLITEVPNKSSSLSSGDRDKVVKGMVYHTKSEQIEVVYKRLADLAGMTDQALTARRNTMFENQKLLMGHNLNVSKLHERYKAFCENILSDKGGKARLQQIKIGNICGGLYTCW